MKGYNISSNHPSDFFISEDSNLVLLMRLFFSFNFTKANEYQLDRVSLREAKERIEIWVEVSLNTRVDLGLNKNHPKTFFINNKEVVLYQKGGPHDAILIQVLELHSIIQQCLINDSPLKITQETL